MRRPPSYPKSRTVPYGVHVRDTVKHQSAWAAYLDAAVSRPGWSVARLAREADVSRATIFRWMNGDVTNIMIANVRAVADALGDDIDTALRAAGAQESDDTESDEPPGPPLHNDEEREFWDLMVRSRVPAEMAVAQLEMFKASRRQAR